MKCVRIGLTPVIVAMGVFDGVHRGHREVFHQLVTHAKKIRGTSIVYTFDPHPARILAPHAAPPMINTIEQRVQLITSCGIRRVIVQRFTKAFSRQTPEDFFRKVVVRRLRAREIFVGYNFTFGIHRSGTVTHLENFGREAGIRVHIVSPFFTGETLVSSTQVRQLLLRAELEEAADLLARPYFMEGRVVRGRGIGGKSLGIHTANLQTHNDLLLPSGVYLTQTVVGGKSYRSLTNIGTNPTFGSGSLSIESHLLDFKKSILGRMIRIEFFKKLREEIVFASAEDLAWQIQNDIRMAHNYFSRKKDP